MRNTFFKRAVLVAVLFAGGVMPAFAEGEVVSYIEPKNAANPAPTVRLDSFQRFEAVPIAMEAPYAGQDANEAAKKSIQANLDLRLQPVLGEWNAKPIGSRCQ